MTKTMTATFATRRDAEMAVEHIVQEHGIDADAVSILPVSESNSAGAKPAGGDLEAGHVKGDMTGEPALAGKIRLSVDVEDAMAEKVGSSFATYGGDSEES